MCPGVPLASLRAGLPSWCNPSRAASATPSPAPATTSAGTTSPCCSPTTSSPAASRRSRRCSPRGARPASPPCCSPGDRPARARRAAPRCGRDRTDFSRSRRSQTRARGPTPRPSPLVLSPVPDSIFVGDSASARIALYSDDRGTLVGPVVPTWASSAPSVVGVDATTGKIAGLARGFAVLTAIYNQAQGQALVVASRPLELSLLLDTVYLMAGDQVTVPVEVKKKGGGAPPAW